MTFYTSRRWVREIPPEDLQHECRNEDTNPFIELKVQDDAEVSVFGSDLLINLRSDWDVSGRTLKKGGLYSVDLKSFLSDPDAVTYDDIFVPSDETALETYTFTKNLLIVKIMDNVKGVHQFWRKKGGERLQILIERTSLLFFCVFSRLSS